MTFRFEFVRDVADRRALEELLVDYYSDILLTFASAGGPELLPREVAADALAHLDAMLPPDGRLLLVHAEDGGLVGCGAMIRIRADAVELKRMFVRPEARGQGLGHRLVDMRLEEARRMGCAAAYTDTVRGNRAMLNLYEKRGFRYIPRYPENANPPEYAPYLVYLECQLGR